jgi:hypothetical protein
MKQIRPLSGVLALATIVLGATAEALSLNHVGGWLALALFGVAVLVAVLAWLALGAPVGRRHLS